MWKPPETSFSKREFLGLAALLAALFIWTLAPLQDYDFWFYLTVARYTLEGNGIPWSESFLGTTSVLSFGRYADHAWLSSFFFYGFYLLGGTWGLVLCKSTLLCSITAISYINCRLMGAAPWFAGLWVALGLWTVRSRFLLRSYHFSDLGLAMIVYFLIRYQHRPGARLVALGTTFCLWSNLHQGVIAGWVLIFLWALLGGTSPKEGFKSLVVVILASLLRPHGHMFPAFIYDHFVNQAAVGGVLEWGPLSPWQLAENIGPFLVVAAVLVLVHFRTGQQRAMPHPWFYLVISLVFLFMAIRSQRAVAELLPVAFPLLIPFFPQLRWSKLRFAGGLILIASLMLYTSPLRSWESMDRLYPRYPTRLQQIASTLPGQLYNSYEYGNYLTFQKFRPFIHGMTALFEEELVLDFQAVLNSSERREAILEKFEVQTVLVHFPEEGGATEGLLNYLYAHPDWKMVAWDDSGFVFTRGPAGEGLVAVKPWLSDMRWNDRGAARAELEHLVQQLPSAQAHVLLSQLASEDLDWPRVIEHTQAAVELVPQAAQAWQAQAFAAFQLGDLATALEASEQAVHWAPQKPEIQFNRAVALLKAYPDLSGLQGWFVKRQIRSHLERTLSLSPENQSARQLLQALDNQ